MHANETSKSDKKRSGQLIIAIWLEAFVRKYNLFCVLIGVDFKRREVIHCNKGESFPSAWSHWTWKASKYKQNSLLYVATMHQNMMSKLHVWVCPHHHDSLSVCTSSSIIVVCIRMRNINVVFPMQSYHFVQEKHGIEEIIAMWEHVEGMIDIFWTSRSKRVEESVEIIINWRRWNGHLHWQKRMRKIVNSPFLM